MRTIKRSDTSLMETSLGPDNPCRQGKVRDIYTFGENLLIIATDRISAFDWVLPNGIPDKGRVLTQLSLHWLTEDLPCPSHLITTEPDQIRQALPGNPDVRRFAGRMMLVRKCEVVPFECVVRGYLAGSGWQEYQKTGAVCGIKLPAGLRESEQLPEPIFTPATKAPEGSHDENISFQRMVEVLRNEALAEMLKSLSITLYDKAAVYARKRGIMIADTKFEFGLRDGAIVLIDEVLTPDSSRFWPADEYEVGKSQPSYDKQFVRDWLTTSGWDKNSQPPALPNEIVERTREKYIQAYETLTGKAFAWK